jgi:putative hemolysin
MDSPLLTILTALLLVFLAGILEGAETGLYRLSRLRLRLGVERRQWSSILLSRAMANSSGLLLSLLVGTTLTHYVATSLTTGMFLRAMISEQAAEFYATLVMTPLLFLFSQLIPKNLFLHRADALTSLVSPLLYMNYAVLKWCGVIPLLQRISARFARLIGSDVRQERRIASSQGREVQALVRDTQEEGLLSSVQMEMMDRVVNIPRLRLSAVMVPLRWVQSMDLRSDRAALLNELGRQALTRLLVWQDTPGNIVGFVDIYDALGSDVAFESLEKFLRPIRRLDADTPVTQAIDVMRRERHKIVLVTAHTRTRQEVPVGIVTMKDLVEELIGELAEW